jgi:hypothetical protein
MFDDATGEAHVIYGCKLNELADELEKAQQRAEEVEGQAKKEAEWARPRERGIEKKRKYSEKHELRTRNASKKRKTEQ